LNLDEGSALLYTFLEDEEREASPRLKKNTTVSVERLPRMCLSFSSEPVGNPGPSGDMGTAP
jgi:hypothetical protein